MWILPERLLKEKDIPRTRRRMVEEQLVSRGIRDPRVIRAMEKVPRHLFVEEALQDQAYSDHPLPIGDKQTISQPYMVALMTEALELKGKEKVLEIGTGSGYQTAVLAECTAVVYSIERIRTLAVRARELLLKLGYSNIEVKFSDGTYGWTEMSPFDAILVTAGAPDIPGSLIGQLKIGGKMVIPVGDLHVQDLVRITKTEEGIKKEDLGGCRFVKLIGKYAWENE
jgi:protein-L-isoaspartate(D-aspartate) O-methyltransferase